MSDDGDHSKTIALQKCWHRVAFAIARGGPRLFAQRREDRARAKSSPTEIDHRYEA